MIKIPNLSGLGKLASMGKTFVVAHRPELLYGASIVSTLSAVVLAGKGGYEAGQKVLIAEHPSVDFSAPIKPLETKDKVKLTWLCYMPAAIATAGSLGSTTGLHLVHIKEKKALVGAALMALDEVKDQANDIKEEALKILNNEEMTPEEKRDALEGVDWRSDAAWSSDILPNDGKYPCWDDLANRPVKSNKEYIRRASEVLLNEINKTGYANLNVFYDEMDMMESQMGSSLGWTKEDVLGYGGKGGTDFVAFGMTEMPDGSTACAFWFREPPTTDYETRAKSVDR